MVQLRLVLLHSTALCLGLAIPLPVTSVPAEASCTSYAPTSGTTVTCSGTITSGVVAQSGSTNVTVNVEEGAQLTALFGVIVRSDSAINLSGSLNVTQHGAKVVGNNGTITLNNTSMVISSSFAGAYISGNDDTITLNGSSHINGGYAAISVFGDNSAINLNDSSQIESQVYGILIEGSGNVITLNDASRINGSGTDQGIAVSGTQNEIFVNYESGIELTADGSNAITFYGGSNSLVNRGRLQSVSTTIIGDDNSSSVDTIANYGTISTEGGTAISLNGGNDSLTLGTGSFITGSIDGGSGTDDLTLVGSGSEDSDFSNFETLTMNGTDWTLSGTSSFDTVSLTGGSFTNAGTLTATGGLSFAGDASLTNSGTLTANITGSSGSDTVENYGTITGAIDLGDGNDSLTLGTDSSISGSIDGGAGSDDLTLIGTGSEDSNIGNFETLTMSGTEWALLGESSFDSITISSGILRVNGDVSGDMTIASAGGLAGTGTFNGDVVSSGTTAPGNSVGMLTINGNFTQTGGNFEVEFDETGNADLLWVTGAVVLDGPTLNVSALNGATSVYDVIVHSDTSIGGTGFSSIVYDGEGVASVEQIGNDLYLRVMDSVSVGAVNVAALQMGLNAFDQFGSNLADTCEEAGSGNRWQMTTGQNCRGKLWARGFGQLASEEVGKDGQDFAYRQTGAAIGGDGDVAEGFRLGGSIGATMGEEEIASKGGESTSEGIVGMLYGTVRRAGAFLSAAIGGGYQRYDLARRASVMGALITAEADTEGVQIGGRLETGAEIGLPKDWVLTPRASALYVHHRIGGYRESGDDGGTVAMDDHNTGSLRLKAEMDAGQRYEADSVVYRPHVKIGVLADVLPGNEVEGYFLDSGEPFALPLSKGERFRALGGIGLEAHFAGGSMAQLSYEGEAGSDSVAHALMATVRFDW